MDTSKRQRDCVVFIADSDQYREDEYQDILCSITEYNQVAESKNETIIDWQVYCGKPELKELERKDVIIVFSSDNMVRCLDHGQKQEMELKVNKNCAEHFELNGAHLCQYLTRTENIHKVFVVESEDSGEIASLGDIPKERTFDGSDIDIEEFIGRILS